MEFRLERSPSGNSIKKFVVIVLIIYKTGASKKSFR